ncbi:MAG TPA: hypothetical protein VIL85_07500 [Thermomicrobiales bacterium]|jgi:hypothetical protein
MLNQRRCCHCGGSGPFARVATCQDNRGEILGYLCLCACCEESLSEGAFRDRILDHLTDRLPPRRPVPPARVTRRVRGLDRL